MIRVLNKIHFIGIGGIGMSALATILLEKGFSVSGSDLCVSEKTNQLVNQGARISKGHSAANISVDCTVIYNSQVQKSNPEYLEALSLKCPLLHRSELLALLMEECLSLTVAGSHGKTTTSALLTAALIEGGYDPTFAVGGMVAGVNGRWGKGKCFVAEADESDGSLLNYHPDGCIITNIEPDHLDYYQTVDHLHKTFRQFIQQIKNPNLFFYCGDDPYLRTLNLKIGFSYGFACDNALQILSFRQQGWSSVIDISFEGITYHNIEIALIGDHNALNATATFGLGIKLGISEESLRKALVHFPGVGRRCERKADAGGILFLDDYAHHPTEVMKTLKGIKEAIQERRLIVVFQPHRYTRLRDCMKEFSQAFEWADDLIITDVYPAFEVAIPGIDAASLLTITKNNGTIPCEYISYKNLKKTLQERLTPHDVLLTMGAGNISFLHKEILEDFQPKKMKVGLIFGGSSCEHEISLRSTRNVLMSLNKDIYEIQFFGIDKEGNWIVGEEAERLLHSAPFIESTQSTSFLDEPIASALQSCDLFLPILHGTYGEDGTIQGFFEMLKKPYIGPDHRSAAICMDKVMTKKLVSLAGIATPKDVSFNYQSWLEKREEMLNDIAEKLVFPVYVKPVHLGSSVGITPVFEFSKLTQAIDLAFRYDTHVMIEEGKMHCRELEFAVIGNTGGFKVDVPCPGEKLAAGDFVDYEKKYGLNCVKTTLHPHLDPNSLEVGKKMARKAYQAVGCTGMTRVDFLLDASGTYWLFEMNPIPGLQEFSLFPKIWQREGVSSQELLDRFIVLALSRHRQQRRHYKCLA